MLQIAVLNQTGLGEPRVALAPAGVKKLAALNVTVAVERGAGLLAGFRDDDYAAVGATPVDSGAADASADVVLVVRDPGADRIARLKPGCVLVGMLAPLGNHSLIEALNARSVSGMALELLPRITRAQTMDVLSSQANLAGYKAVILAAAAAPRIFPMLMTAAGTLQAAKVFVVGAGVAGLQAIATARRLGAVVSAYDVRPAVKEQVQSVGARFVELPLDTADAQDAGGYAKAQSGEVLDRQRRLLAKPVGESDVVITTALVPGQPAPKLISADAVAAMKRGSVVVDLATERGGNCDLTAPGQTITTDGGVTVIGIENLAATVPGHASQMFSSNVVNLLSTLIDKQGALKLDLEDAVVAGILVCHGGTTVNGVVLKSLGLTVDSAVAVATSVNSETKEA